MVWDVSWDGVTRLKDAKLVIAASFIHEHLKPGMTIEAWDHNADRVVVFLGTARKKRLVQIGRELNVLPSKELDDGE